MSRRRKLALAVGGVLVVAIAVALTWFQPWKLFVDHRVNEALPTVAARTVPPSVVPPSVVPPSVVPPTAEPSPSSSTRTVKPHDVLLSRGTLISHEHDTSGTVSVVRLANGKRVLAIANLSTSDGPDVHVWLTDQPVKSGEDGWYVFDDGKHVSLGTLKGNLGNQVYSIPDDADLSSLTSVSIWCARFDVSFGAAQLVGAG